MSDRLLLDTSFVQVLLNRRDQYHSQARAFLPRLQAATEVWITEAVIVEIGNALSTFDRQSASRFIERCYQSANMLVVTVNTALLLRALQLYRERTDKGWGLNDCISFVVMQDHALTDAVTTDRHFSQAGYNALLI